MKRKTKAIVGIGILLISGIVFAAPVTASPTENESTTDNPKMVADYVVTINNGEIKTDSTSHEEIKQDVEKSRESVVNHLTNTEGVSIKQKYWISNTIQITADLNQTSVATIQEHPEITSVSKDQTIAPPDQPDQPGDLATTEATTPEDVTYGLSQVNAPEAWEQFNATGEGVNVTVIDTGVDTDHPDITLNGGDAANNYEGGWAIYNKSTTNDSTPLEPVGTNAPAPFDSDTGLFAGGHGTHVSGTVTGGNATGTHIGVAPNATLQHVAVFDTYDGEYGAKTSDVISAIQWAATNDADIISLSLGGPSPNPAYVDAVDNARQQGIIVISSVGNNGDGNTSAPADIESVTSIGATDQTNRFQPSPVANDSTRQRSTQWRGQTGLIHRSSHTSLLQEITSKAPKRERMASQPKGERAWQPHT